MTTELATMNIITLKYVPTMKKYKLNIKLVKNAPINGVALVTGSMSPTIVLKRTMARRRLTPSDNFSPESGGSVKPSTAIEAISRHGTIRLKK